MGEKKHKGLYGILIGYFCLMIAATNSRTAVSVTAFELVLLALSIAWVRTADYTRKGLAIICICLCGFGFNLINFKSADIQVVPKVSAAEAVQVNKKGMECLLREERFLCLHGIILKIISVVLHLQINFLIMQDWQ